MSARPILLDLYCCEGGAARGYDRAGFRVFGVDLDARALARHYPYPAAAGDVLDVLRDLLDGRPLVLRAPGGGDVSLYLDEVDAIHASPPCQAYSITRHSHSNTHPDLLAPTRELLRATGKPYVIENVVGAPMIDPLRLCGSEFGLRATDTDGTPLRMERHRLFESNVLLMGAGGCQHDKRVQVAGAYGGGSVDRSHAKHVRRGGYTPAKAVRAALLGLPETMTLHGLSQSIPPAYTEHVGTQILAHIDAEAAA